MMKIDAMMGGLSVRESRSFAVGLEAAGFDGVWVTEGGRTPYLACTAAALATEVLEIGTGIAVAFPRSPMVTAATAWELAEASDGRFVLGLGTQVKAHIVRRYGVEFSPPGPRLRDYVLAVKAIFEAFQTGGKLDYHGSYYKLDLLPAAWRQGPIGDAALPIYLSAVRPWMLQLCGEIADGVHVHPLHSRRYLDEIVRPNVALGASRAGRDPREVHLVCPVMTITGDSDAELEMWRSRARTQLAFYGSTPGYELIFDVHGWTGTGARLNQLMRAGDMAALSATITDEMLDVFAVTAKWDRLADALVDRFHGSTERVICYFVGTGWKEDPRVLDRWAEVTAAVKRRLAA